MRLAEKAFDAFVAEIGKYSPHGTQKPKLADMKPRYRAAFERAVLKAIAHASEAEIDVAKLDDEELSK